MKVLNLSKRPYLFLKIIVVVLFSAFFAYFILEAFFNAHLPQFVDIGAFSEPSYNLAFKGILGMISWGNLWDFDKYTYGIMPLYFLPQALVYKLLGFGLFQITMLPFLISLVLLTVTYLFAKDVFNEKVAWMSLLLLLSNIVFITTSITNRPDILAGFFTTLSFFLLWKFAKNKSPIVFGFSVLSASLALLSHGVGLITIIVVYTYLLISCRKDYKKFLKISLLSLPFLLIPFIPYLWYIGLSPQSFLLQLKWEAYLQWDGKILLSGVVEEIIKRYPRLLLYTPILSLAAVLSLFYYIKKRDKEGKFYLTVLFLWLFLLAFLIGNHHFLSYFVSIFPVISIFTANVLVEKLYKKEILAIFLLILIFHILFISSRIVSIVPLISNYPSFQEVGGMLSEEVGDNAVVAPQFYFLYFQENLKSFYYITIKMQVENKSMGEILENISHSYVIVDDDFIRNIKLWGDEKFAEMSQYLREKYVLTRQIENRRVLFINLLRPPVFKCFLEKISVDCLVQENNIYVYKAYM